VGIAKARAAIEGSRVEVLIAFSFYRIGFPPRSKIAVQLPF
jgi:hypothetical protein